jgi:hypothetical protein
MVWLYPMDYVRGTVLTPREAYPCSHGATATASADATAPAPGVIQDFADMADYDDQRRVPGWHP